MTIEVIFTKARATLAALCNAAGEFRETVIIHRRNAADVALIAADELAGLAEMAFLFNSPGNAERLFAALARARANSEPASSLEEMRRDLGVDRRAGNAEAPQRQPVFHPEFQDDLRYWKQTDWRNALLALDMAEAILGNPFSTIGKPERLRHLGNDIWSRHLTQEHRLVYVLKQDRVEFLQCRHRPLEITAT